jgi:hypothetical protein
VGEGRGVDPRGALGGLWRRHGGALTIRCGAGQQKFSLTKDECRAKYDAMTKKKLRELENILQSLKRGQTFLKDERTLVCRKKSVATTTLDFKNEKGEVCVSVDKWIGSDLTGVDMGVESLAKFIEAAQNK